MCLLCPLWVIIVQSRRGSYAATTRNGNPVADLIDLLGGCELDSKSSENRTSVLSASMRALEAATHISEADMVYRADYHNCLEAS
jgi:hypothetical protein